MKIVKEKDANECDIRDLIDRFICFRIPSIDTPIDDVINILVEDCCEFNKDNVHTLAEQLRLYDKLTDKYIELLINGCFRWHIPELAEQIRLANKLTDKYIELLIYSCCRIDIPRLVQQIPDNYKPTKAVIELLEAKGYKVL